MNEFGHTQVILLGVNERQNLVKKCGHNQDSHILPNCFHPWKVLINWKCFFCAYVGQVVKDSY